MKNVLVVDDAKFMRKMVKDAVEKIGVNVIGEASNGNEAIELYEKYRPDIVTMDITMPIKDGIQAVKEIMAFDHNANIIMVSAMGQQGMVLEAIKSGAKNFIVKPFRGDVIEGAIKQFI